MANYKFETLQVRAAHTAEAGTGACATPIYQTSAYAFKDTSHATRLFTLEEAGNIYSRINNPTNEVFENRIAALEGGIAAVAVSSGMAAQFLTIQTIAKAGDNIVSSVELYGGTFSQFRYTLPALGVEIRLFKAGEDIEHLIDRRTKALYVESIANSDLSVPDFGALSKIAHRHKIPLIVDNTVGCGGYLCRPLELGANIVTHSATKWINGHGNSMAGVVVDGGNFDWESGKFPDFVEPNQAYHGLSFSKTFGKAAFAAKLRTIGLRDLGCCLSPFNAFLSVTGVETLSLRAQRICDNALKIAQWLEENSKVSKVSYPGLASHKTHENAVKYLQNGFGGIIFLDLKATKEQTLKVVDRLKLFMLLTNLGDNKSNVTHPASTTHSQLNEEELAKSGISVSTIRLCIGIEHVDDLIADLEQALSIL